VTEAAADAVGRVVVAWPAVAMAVLGLLCFVKRKE
jgi:hypothetical protein